MADVDDVDMSHEEATAAVAAYQIMVRLLLLLLDPVCCGSPHRGSRSRNRQIYAVGTRRLPRKPATPIFLVSLSEISDHAVGCRPRLYSGSESS